MGGQCRAQRLPDYRRTFRQEPADGNDYEALAAAHERALAAVSREIAVAVMKEKTKPGTRR